MTSHEESKQPFSAMDKELPWSEGSREYFDYVDDVMERNLDMDFGNGRPLHAAYLIYKFFSHARREMRLFSGSLLRRVREGGLDGGLLVYEDERVLDAVRGFLSKDGTSLKIVVSDPLDIDEGQAPEDHPLMKAIQALSDEGKLKGSCEIRRIGKNEQHILHERNRHYHLLLMDRKAYRFERDAKKYKALVNVNDGKLTKILVDFFDETLLPMSGGLWMPQVTS